MDILAKNLKTLREYNSLRLNEMQAECGFPRSTWNGYERGTSFPSIKDFSRISDYFGVLESDLLYSDIERIDDISTIYIRFLVTKKGITPAAKSFTDWYSSHPEQIASITKGTFLPEKLPESLPKSDQNHDQEASNKKNIASDFSISYGLQMPKIVTVNEHGIDNIIYVPVKARAGYQVGFGDPEFIETLPTLRMPGLNNKTYRMFEVDGLSMAGVLSDRDRVIAEWVPSINEIRENRVHVIVTGNGILIKRVLNRVPQRGKIYLKSDTITHRADYPIQEIEADEIMEIWYVNMKVSSDLSEPSEIYQRVSDLEIFKHEVMKHLKMKDPVKAKGA